MARKGFRKYNAKKANCSHGHTHDSKREADRCDYLHIRQAAGEISRLETQVQFRFAIDGRAVKHDNGRSVGVKLDFTYTDSNGDLVAEDSKPKDYRARGRDWPIRKAIFKSLFPEIRLLEV